MPPKKSKSQTTTSLVEPIGKVKLQTLLGQIREICRTHHQNVWKTQSLANQIYQDLLFMYHIPELMRSGKLTLDTERIGDGKITEVSYSSLLSLKEPQLINASFKRLWKELQRSELKDLFEARDFTLVEIEKKNPERYMKLLLELFKYLASITLETYDSNAGYTYFKKDLNKAIAKTFGQFYTPPTVTYSVVKEVNPSTRETILDPSSGSCSFLAEAANFIVKKEGVDMKTAFENLYGTEVEFNIYAEGIMNMFINFGIIPDMKSKIREVDALLAMAKETVLYDKIIANPPFGADASTFHEFYYKTEMESKGKRMVKKTIVNPEVKCDIPFPLTKESAVLFFQYIIQKLKVGGKAGVVMSSTLLNDGNKEMIKWFLETCSLDKVIINPAGTFKEQGTGIETFSFVFTKGKPTTTVSIVMLGVEEKIVKTLTLAEIEAAGWKLQLKEEEKKEVYTGKYSLVKLSSVADGENGKGLGMDETKENPGEYRILSGGQNYCGSFSKYNRPENTISVSKSGSSSGFIKWNTTKFWASDCFTVTTKDENILNNRFLFYLLSLQQDLIYEKYQVGGTIPHCYWRDMESMLIPIAPITIQREIVTSLDRILANPQDSKDCLAFTSNGMELMLKDPSGKLLEDIVNGLRLKRAHLAATDSVKAQMAAVVRSVGQRGYEKKKLGDVSSMVKGNAFKTSEFLKSGFPILKVSDLQNESIDMTNLWYTEKNDKYNQFLVKEDDILLVVTGSSTGKVAINTTGIEFYLNQNSVVLRSNQTLLCQKYLLYQLLSDEVQKNILNNHSGSAQPFVSCKSVNSLEIPIPPLAVQEEVLTKLNEMEAERKTLEQMAAKAEERAKFILNNYLTPVQQETPEEEELVF